MIILASASSLPVLQGDQFLERLAEGRHFEYFR
jgi:hypothetical protein